ncbi:hypothetical protein [Arthrobacter sp. Y-9]|uniref:hypothetical protein n=1 Tax=Arthrobacter sp. Y-9 TaxID=3039385 RepID=UPI00241ED823|nr:hypothetical protein [Arthrobacter sp. Y-9]WFR84529.1 hypothetical protein P9849_02460 [Arthrobacter sp. Y-9]
MRTRTKALIWTVLGALVIAFIVFAPVAGAGICVDAQDTSKSYCRDWQVSLLGLETTLWWWLGASGVLVAVALLVVGLAGRRSASHGRRSGDGRSPGDRPGPV